MNEKKRGSAVPSPKESIEQASMGMSPLAKLAQSRETPHRIITFPGYPDDDDEAKVAVIALNDYELQTARLEAIKWLTKTQKMDDWLLETGLGHDMLQNEIQSQVLYNALRNPKMLTAKFASSVNEIRLYLEPGVRLALWNEYAPFQDERNPLRHLSDEELEEVIASLGKGSSQHDLDVLSYYDISSLRSIVVALAARLTKLMRQHYSPITRPSDSDQSSSPGSNDESDKK